MISDMQVSVDTSTLIHQVQID